MNWAFMPPWSARLIAALALVLVVASLLRWWRERHHRLLLGLRAVIIAALALILMNPQAFVANPRPEKPRLTVLLDTSASMWTRDVGNASRLETAARTLNDPATLATLKKEFDLEVRRFDRAVRPAELGDALTNAPAGDASDIAAALTGAVSDLGDLKAQAGVLLISDGRATAPGAEAAARLALARSVPLWTWCLGGPVPRHDVWIETVSSEALAFSGADVELTATLREAGYPNRSFRVDLLRDDKIVESRDAVPDTNGVCRLSFHVTAPASGEQRYVFRTPPQPDEADIANNERAVFLRAVGEKVRVLLAEGQPHWETKFLVQALQHDPHVDLTAVYRLNAARNLAVVSATNGETRVERDLFPRTAAELNNFDVIIFGRGVEAFFDANTETLLNDFVNRRGGSVVFARGKPYDGRFPPLARLEPVAWGEGAASAVRLRVTDAGRENPIFDLGTSGGLDDLLNRLPALDLARVTLGEKPLAVVLAQSEEEDGPVLLAYQRYGQGRTLALNAAGLWRWDFREEGQEESEAAYRRFWVSQLQWLLSGSQFLPNSDVAMATARRYYTDEQPLQFLISTRNIDRAIYQPKLEIAGGTNTVAVGPRPRGESFVAEAGPFPPGTYRVTLRNNVGRPAEISQSVEVVSSSIENRELSADPELMKQLAAISTGAVVDARDVAHLPDVVRRWEISQQLAHRQETVWDQWWLLGGMVALLGTEWWLRRKEGLL